jgi:predicted glutamine amidotransferase
MKLKMIFFSVAFFLVANVASAFTIRYANNDSQNYTMEVRSNGSTQKIDFTSSTTGSSSVQTSASEVEIKTSCGWVKVKDGAKISIKNGCIKIE